MAEIIKAYYLEHKIIFEENFKIVLDNFDVEAIHKMRTSTKRLRALFLLIEFLTENHFKAKRQLRKLRQVFKHAGKIREIQIEALLIKAYELKLNLTFPEYLEYLKRREYKEIAAFLKSIPPIRERDRILKDDKIIATIDQLTNKDLQKGTADFLLSKVFAIRDHINAAPSNHRIHENRTYLKQIYYLFGILSVLSNMPEILKTDVIRIRDMEQFLGTWHDLVNSPVYMNAFLQTKNTGKIEKYKKLRNAIKAERKEMRQVILNEFYPELLADIQTAK
ncbi:MAG TPA: CHAD domain-containing protein [Bacteroidales bacterium]|nr:CHAD domain-containing protein [Bacteroidales bacterium]HRX96830.1 CHAD domain-containing protein [Bacteroidales bacterium]